MKRAVVRKGLNGFMAINLICLFLAGCGADASEESSTADPVSRYMDSMQAEDGAAGDADGSSDSSSSSSVTDAGGESQPNIMENPAYNALGRQVLTAAVASPVMTSDILGRIQAFNAVSPSYFVEVEDYTAEGARVLDAETLATRLPLEILSGKGPDLVIWDGYCTPSLASEKLMVDLHDFMDADSAFHREDYFENILQALEINGGLYVFPTTFSVRTMCGKAEELGTGRGTMEGWEFGEILEAFANSPHAETVFQYPNKEYTLEYVVGGCMGNFVDWSSGECCFDTPEFVEMLEFCNTLPDGLDGYGSESQYEFYSSGKCLVYHIGLSSPWQMAEVRARFGDADMLWPGIPVADGEKELGGGVAVPWSECISICRNSSNQEGAWEFLKSYLTEDVQREMEGNPILRSVFEEKIQDALTVEYQTINGMEQEKIKYRVLLTEREGAVGFSCITEEDAETYRGIIEDAHRSSWGDSGIMDIIMEEAGSCFSGDKDAATVADIIQNRVSMYVAERM